MDTEEKRKSRVKRVGNSVNLQRTRIPCSVVEISKIFKLANPEGAGGFPCPVTDRLT